MTETKTVRWGVLGASNIAKRFVADAHTVDGTEVVAVGARDLDRATAWAQENNVPTAYGSWEELAAAPNIDVVYVSTVHSWHYAGAKLCLENGKSVLVEKPFTVHLRDAEELVSIASDNGLFVMEAVWTRCNPLIRELKAFVDRGDLGEVIQIQSNLGPSAGRNPRLWDLSVGGGVLLETSVYPLAFAYLFLGAPERVVAASHFGDGGIDDSTSLLLEYAGGASATLTSSVSRGVTTPHHSFGDVIGTRGWISVPTNVFFPEQYTIHLSGSSDPIHVERPKVGNGYTEEAAEVSRCIREGLTESPLLPVDDTLGAMRVIDAAYQQVGITYPETPTLARA